MTEKVPEKKTERPASRIPELLAREDIQAFVHEYYARQGKDKYSKLATFRWKKETHYPPLDILIGMAKIAETNISYILGLTDEDCVCDYDHEPIQRRLQDLLSVRKMTKKELISALNNNYKTVYHYEEELPKQRILSLVKLCRAMRLSADYILGYTNWETWETCSQINRSFRGIKAGSGAYVVADKDVHSAEDILKAIRRGDGQYCLLSTDGEYVLFPNGNKLSVDDELFIGAYVARVLPEVK